MYYGGFEEHYKNHARSNADEVPGLSALGLLHDGSDHNHFRHNMHGLNEVRNFEMPGLNVLNLMNGNQWDSGRNQWDYRMNYCNVTAKYEIWGNEQERMAEEKQSKRCMYSSETDSGRVN